MLHHRANSSAGRLPLMPPSMVLHPLAVGGAPGRRMWMTDFWSVVEIISVDGSKLDCLASLKSYFGLRSKIDSCVPG